MIGVPGSEKSSELISSILRRLLPSSGARRRRMPRLMRARGSCGINAIHVVALLVGDHFQRQLVVVAQKNRPLAILRNRRRLLENVDDREAILHLQRHEHSRHEREVELHVALVALAEIGHGIFRPLIGLGEQHPIGELRIDVRAQLAEEGVGLGQVLAVRILRARRDTARRRGAGRPRPFPARNRWRAEVPSWTTRILEIQVGLMGIKPMPEIGFGDRIPGPVRGLEILKDDPRVAVFVRVVAPDVEVALGRSRRAPGVPVETTRSGPTYD